MQNNFSLDSQQPSENSNSVLTLYGREIKFKPAFPSYSPITDEEKFDKRFSAMESIYDSPLSPTIINSAYDSFLKTRVALKIINKSKLKQIFHHELIKQEAVVHHFLCRVNPDNITMMFDYFEFTDRYVFILELSNDPTYFEDRLETVNS